MDIDRFRTTLQAIRRCIGYESYGVTLILVDDDEMRQTNRESRSINAPTDILSFPFHPAIEPGALEPLEPPFDQIPDYLMVDVPYVQRGCRDDEQDSQQQHHDDDGDDDEEYEEVEEEERGVSGAMATVFNPEERIHMLLVHGMLHLVGYDHETDEDYERMVTKEEEILQQLGLPTRTNMER
jgi:ssRNA-specific RNase YbeY (16S rRNA maturation enzyme)